MVLPAAAEEHEALPNPEPAMATNASPPPQAHRRLPQWLDWLAAPPPAGQAPAQAPPGAIAQAPADETTDAVPPRGCGWFDSSLDLRHGLQVLEHSRVDGLAEVLPAAHWLAFELGVPPGAGSGVGCGVAATTRRGATHGTAPNPSGGAPSGAPSGTPATGQATGSRR
jgi:hypothetical protein